MKMIRRVLLTVSALSLGFAAEVSADEGGQVRSIVVRYGDLDLSGADGAAALYRRFEHAAWEVCKKPGGAFGDPAVFLHCYHDALAHAVRDLDNAGVTAKYNREHTEKLPPASVTARLIR